MKLHIPNSAFLGNIDCFIRNFDNSDPASLEITANQKWIAVHPLVLVMTAALAARVGAKNVVCREFEAKSKHYLQRMGLFEWIGAAADRGLVEHEPAGRFIPIQRIRSSSELERFITEMIPLLHLEPPHSQTIVYIVSELARNVLEHAESEHGAFLSAQYYKKSNSIRIGIADTGIGIRRAITRSHAAADDLAAIRLALTPGITGTTTREGGTAQNAGAGLFFTKSIASVNRDFLVVYSGSGFYKLLKKAEDRKNPYLLREDPFKDRHSALDALPAWPGTVVGIDITLDRTGEFDALLDAIRMTYGRAVRDRRSARYRKPRFT